MENEEIDLIEVIGKLWHRRRVIWRFVLFFFIAGAAFAFLLPRKYTAQCTLGLEAEDHTTRISVEGMSAFQSMNVGDVRSNSVIAPSMYPDIFFSVPFQKELIYSPLYVNEKGDSVTFYNYLIASASSEIPLKEKSGTGVEQLTPEEKQCLDYLKTTLTITLHPKEKSLKISADMPEAKLAAQLTHEAQVLLQRYIAKFRVAKAQAVLDFIEERYAEVKNELEERQKAIVEFQEEHHNRPSVKLETEERILMNDYELFFSLYADIVKQREKARMQVKEDMPTLTVIEPVVEPSVPSKPQRALILSISLILGFFIGCGWVLISPLFRQIREVHIPRLTPVQKAS